MQRDFARVPGADVHDDAELLWFTVPSQNSWLNGASRSSLREEDADEAIARVVGHIHALGRNVLWHVGPTSSPRDLTRRLERAGFEGDVSPGMALEIGSVQRPLPPTRLVIAPVRTQDDLRDWLLAFDLGMEIDPPRADAHPWLTPFAHLALPPETPTELFVGRVDGEPVASSLAFTGGGAVGLYGVATAPAHRGRGYGSALTLAGIDWGASRGEGTAILHASEMGRPVYKRLGFRTVAEQSGWLKVAPPNM
jgi:GNAT superfamily N-acetyltransferase